MVDRKGTLLIISAPLVGTIANAKCSMQNAQLLFVPVAGRRVLGVRCRGLGSGRVRLSIELHLKSLMPTMMSPDDNVKNCEEE